MSPEDMPLWEGYEQAAFDAFRTTGHRCERDVVVPGARGHHQIDVLVHMDSGPGNHRWIVECKNWQRRPGKRDLQSLGSVVEDLGADHGFLIAENGFQRGAIDMARTLNITLTSLSELQARFAAEQLSPGHRQSKAFVSSVRIEEDEGGAEFGTVKLLPTQTLSVAQHILEVHVMQGPASAWIMSKRTCLPHINAEGLLELIVPNDAMWASNDSTAANSKTLRSKVGWDLTGPFRVVFRTLSGPVSAAPFHLMYK